MLKKLIPLLFFIAPLFAQNVFPPNGGSSGGTCNTLGGDLTGTCTAATVVAVNGMAVPLSATIVSSNSSRQLVPGTIVKPIGASFGSFQSGATALSGSLTACVPTYYTGTIQSVELISDVSGSVTVDVKTVAHSSWTGTASATSITASAIPALSSAARYTDSTLTGWTTSVTAGTDFCFVLTSPTTVAGVTISLKLAVTN